MTDDLKISDKDGFDEYSAEEQAQILKIEETMQQLVDIYSSFFKLRKPVNEYADITEIYAEQGFTFDQNYTEAPGDDFTQVDKYVWHRRDSGNNTISVIDTEKHVRVDIDYGRRERRAAEIESGSEKR